MRKLLYTCEGLLKGLTAVDGRLGGAGVFHVGRLPWESSTLETPNQKVFWESSQKLQWKSIFPNLSMKQQLPKLDRVMW